MQTTLRLIEAVKRKHGITSDYGVSKHLGITRQSISGYTSGTHTIGDDVALRIADDLGLDRAAVLVALNLERAKSDGARKVWADQLKRLGGIAAGVLVLAGGAALPSPAQAGAGPGGMAPPVYYVKSRRRPHKGTFSSVLQSLILSIAPAPRLA